MKVRKLKGEVAVKNKIRKEEHIDMLGIGEETREVDGNRIVNGFCFEN